METPLEVLSKQKQSQLLCRYLAFYRSYMVDEVPKEKASNILVNKIFGLLIAWEKDLFNLSCFEISEKQFLEKQSSISFYSPIKNSLSLDQVKIFIDNENKFDEKNNSVLNENAQVFTLNTYSTHLLRLMWEKNRLHNLPSFILESYNNCSYLKEVSNNFLEVKQNFDKCFNETNKVHVVIRLVRLPTLEFLPPYRALGNLKGIFFREEIKHLDQSLKLIIFIFKYTTTQKLKEDHEDLNRVLNQYQPTDISPNLSDQKMGIGRKGVIEKETVGYKTFIQTTLNYLWNFHHYLYIGLEDKTPQPRFIECNRDIASDKNIEVWIWDWLKNIPLTKALKKEIELTLKLHCAVSPKLKEKPVNFSDNVHQNIFLDILTLLTIKMRSYDFLLNLYNTWYFLIRQCRENIGIFRSPRSILFYLSSPNQWDISFDPLECIQLIQRNYNVPIHQIQLHTEDTNKRKALNFLLTIIHQDLNLEKWYLHQNKIRTAAYKKDIVYINQLLKDKEIYQLVINIDSELPHQSLCKALSRTIDILKQEQEGIFGYLGIWLSPKRLVLFFFISPIYFKDEELDHCLQEIFNKQTEATLHIDNHPFSGFSSNFLNCRKDQLLQNLSRLIYTGNYRQFIDINYLQLYQRIFHGNLKYKSRKQKSAPKKKKEPVLTVKDTPQEVNSDSKDELAQKGNYDWGIKDTLPKQIAQIDIQLHASLFAESLKDKDGK